MEGGEVMMPAEVHEMTGEEARWFVVVRPKGNGKFTILHTDVGSINVPLAYTPEQKEKAFAACKYINDLDQGLPV